LLVKENQLNKHPFNETKRETLRIINNLGEATAWQIALITGKTPEACSMALLRYHEMGLLSRQTLKGRTKIYELTPRGRERLEWLKQSI